MKSKPVIPRAAARHNVDTAIDYYLSEGADQTAINFIGVLEQAYAQISRHPTTGSPRYAHALDLPGRRFWPLRRFPYLVFYIEQNEHIDVWRVLHGQRDIPERMTSIE
ncbi:MAG: toxin ParE1/3/4 [Alphaproteobacteria bacterium]|nr:toxin ParE1/3/4 [Alphaproteobacteria bacterium]